VIDFADRLGEVRHFIHRRTIGAIGGFLQGGPTGAVAGFLTKGRSRRTRRSRSGRSSRAQRRAERRSLGSGRNRSGRSGAALAQGSSAGGAARAMVAAQATGNGCPQGFHPNKSDYMTRAGFVAKATKCVRNRRRNLSNGRANTRSLRRMAAWDKQERKLGKTLKAIARGR